MLTIKMDNHQEKKDLPSDLTLKTFPMYTFKFRNL